jgi:hypothetical protein
MVSDAGPWGRRNGGSIRRVTPRIPRSERAVGDVALCVRRLVFVAALSIGLAACAITPGGGVANACQLPAYTPASEEGASNGPPVVVSPACTVALGPNDDGHRLTVDPGTLVSVATFGNSLKRDSPRGCGSVAGTAIGR